MGDVSGLLRTGINILSAILLLAGSAIPVFLKEIGTSQRLRSISMRSFTTSFIISILMVIQMLTRGWASMVPVLTAITLALLGIASYMLSAKEGRLVPPSLREILLVTSIIIVFSTPIIQLSLQKLGASIEVSRAIPIGLFVAFSVMIYISIKMPFKKVQNVEEKAERNP